MATLSDLMKMAKVSPKLVTINMSQTTEFPLLLLHFSKPLAEFTVRSDWWHHKLKLF